MKSGVKLTSTLSGYTGRLVIRYLATHRDRTSFTFGLAGRSKSKLDRLVSDLDLAGVKTFTVDVLDDVSIERLFDEAQPKVLLTTVGPYWTYGFPVARACARVGVHYVDITAEMHFVRRLIDELDSIATKTHAILVPCCGLGSLPSDALAFLSAETMRSAPGSTSASYDLRNVGVKESHTMFDMKISPSGGSLATMISLFETFRPGEILKMLKPDFLSPVKLRKPSGLRLVYRLPARRPVQYGWLSPLAVAGNTCVVYRTWGLLELKENAVNSISGEGEDLLPAYGKDFDYSESLAATNYFSAFFSGLGFVLGMMSLLVFPPLIWLAKRLVIAPGEGPSEEFVSTFFFVCLLQLLTHSPQIFKEGSHKGP